MKTLYYLSFNNYYNRLMKRYETLDEYLAAGAIPCGTSTDVNFSVNDGIYAQHTPYINSINDIPDYLLVVNEGAIESRWFVTECRYNTGKTQYICSLYRDLIAEFWNQVVEKPFFCEKGWLSTLDNGIFNDEAITTNQIKKKEEILYDPTGCPWIVGYYALPESGESDKVIHFSTTEITPDLEINGISNWSFYNESKGFVDDWNLDYYYKYDRLIFDDEYWVVPFKPGEKGTPFKTSLYGGGNWRTGKSPSSFATDVAALSDKGNYPTLLKTQFAEYANLSFDNTNKALLLGQNGKIIKDTSDQKIYKVNVRVTQLNTELATISTSSALGQTMLGMLGSGGDEIMFSMSGTASEFNLRYSTTYSFVKIELVDALVEEGSVVIKAVRRPLYDAPYCMFAIPYGPLSFAVDHSVPLGDVLTTQIVTNALNGINLAEAIAAGNEVGVYDIQLVPYCPIRKIREAATMGPFYLNLTKAGFIEDQDFSVAIGDTNNPLQVLFWCDISSDNFILDSTLDEYKSSNITNNPREFKVGNQTEFLRLCSPNYNGVFEINPYKNRGIDYFTVSYTYKPYQPFIQISPNFKGLYGADYDDARGLILGGDFSLPTINDQWKNYEVQNKNYQSMFNRQIENMEVQHKYQRRQDIANAITGTLSGGVSGGMAGGMAGGPWAAVAGAAAGAIGSGIGGYYDYQAGEALRAETIDYTKDQFGYQLDNIKALPNALTRVSAFNIKNKNFPFIEVYDCTEEEKEAVRNKILYNGMTVGRIGTIQQFLGDSMSYVKGQIIRLDNIVEDSHVVSVLADELNKGVFVK